MNGEKLVQEVMRIKNLTSKNALAKLLDTDRQKVYQWSKSMPDAVTALRLAEEAGLSAKETRKLLEGGYSEIALLIVLASSTLLLLNIDLLAYFMHINVYYVKCKL